MIELSPGLYASPGDFTRYDEHAVRQIDRNIELMRYRRFGEDLLALELVHRTSASQNLTDGAENGNRETRRQTSRTSNQAVAELATPMQDLFEAVRAYLLALGEDVERTSTQPLSGVPTYPELLLAGTAAEATRPLSEAGPSFPSTSTAVTSAT